MISIVNMLWDEDNTEEASRGLDLFDEWCEDNYAKPQSEQLAWFLSNPEVPEEDKQKVVNAVKQEDEKNSANLNLLYGIGMRTDDFEALVKERTRKYQKNYTVLALLCIGIGLCLIIAFFVIAAVIGRDSLPRLYSLLFVVFFAPIVGGIYGLLEARYSRKCLDNSLQDLYMKVGKHLQDSITDSEDDYHELKEFNKVIRHWASEH